MIALDGAKPILRSGSYLTVVIPRRLTTLVVLKEVLQDIADITGDVVSAALHLDIRDRRGSDVLAMDRAMSPAMGTAWTPSSSASLPTFSLLRRLFHCSAVRDDLGISAVKGTVLKGKSIKGHLLMGKSQKRTVIKMGQSVK